FTALQQGQRNIADDTLQQNQDKTNTHGHQKCTQECSPDFTFLFCTQRLGYKTGCTHAQKTKTPVHKTEDDGSEGNSAKISQRTKIADHSGIRQAEQGHCRIRQNYGPGFVQNVPIAQHGIYSEGFSAASRRCSASSASWRACSITAMISSILASASRRSNLPVSFTSGCS